MPKLCFLFCIFTLTIYFFDFKWTVLRPALLRAISMVKNCMRVTIDMEDSIERKGWSMLANRECGVYSRAVQLQRKDARRKASSPVGMSGGPRVCTVSVGWQEWFIKNP